MDASEFVRAFIKDHKELFSTDDLGTPQKKFFVRRRGLALGLTTSGLEERLLEEMSLVQAYVTAKVGKAGSLLATGAVADYHLDLVEAANWHPTAAGRAKRRKTFATDRVRRASTIIWRATAIHADQLFSGGPIALVEAPLNELVDRRLRTVERMDYHLNSSIDFPDWPGNDRVFTGEPLDADGPWNDGLQRIFDYNNVPSAQLGGLGLWTPPDGADADQWKKFGDHIVFQGPQNARRMWWMTPAIAGAWTRPPNGIQHWSKYVTGVHAHATVLYQMFIPTANLYNRCLFGCNLASSAVLLEALWFGLRRRGQEATFNALMESNPPYVYLGTMLTRDGTLPVDLGVSPIVPSLMADANDEYFENTPTADDDVQIGDFVYVWNNSIYEALIAGDWKLEASVFSDVGGWGAGFTSILGADAGVVGHGIKAAPPNKMRGYLASSLGKLFEKARNAANGQTSPYAYKGTFLVKWNPYGDFAIDNIPWWIKIFPDMYWKICRAATLSEAVPFFPGAYTKTDAGPSSGWPVGDDDMLFPLYQPVMPGTKVSDDPWRKYFTMRIGGTGGWDRALIPLVIDSRYAPGIVHIPSDPTKFPLLRPKVRLSPP